MATLRPAPPSFRPLLADDLPMLHEWLQRPHVRQWWKDVAEWDGDVTGVRLDGRLDTAGADAIGLRFTASVVARARPAAIDLSGVSYVSSMGLRLLIAAARGLQSKGARMVMFGATEFVQDVFEQTALGQLIDIVPSREQALERLAAS